VVRLSRSFSSRFYAKGLFHGPLVLQVFAVHLTAVSGAVTVPRTWSSRQCEGRTRPFVRSGYLLILPYFYACELIRLLHRSNEDLPCGADGFISMDSLKSAPKSGSGIIKARNESTGKDIRKIHRLHPGPTGPPSPPIIILLSWPTFKKGRQVREPRRRSWCLRSSLRILNAT